MSLFGGITSAFTGGLSDLFQGNFGGAATMGASDILGLTGKSKSGGKNKTGQPKYLTKYNNLLGALIGSQGKMYDSEAMYSPKYTELGLKNLGTTITGNQETPGLLDLYGQTVKSGISNVANNSPAAMEAITKADPATAGLYDKLTAEANRGLDLGANLDPSLTRLATQSVRSQNSGMLGGTGNAGDYAQALGLSQFGQGLKQNRQAFAQDVAGERTNYFGNWIKSLMNPASGNTLLSAGLGVSGPAGQSGVTSDQNSNLLNTAFGTQMAQNMNTANNRAALTGAGISAAGSLVGGGLSAI